MKQDSNSNTALFLMELIAVIGFFSLVSVVCVRLFVAANAASARSVNVNQAIRTEESLIEVWTACEGDLTKTALFYPGAVAALDGQKTEDGTLTILLDADWNPVSASGAYRVLLSARETPAGSYYENAATGYCVVALVTVEDLSDGSEICSLQADHYTGGAR